MHAKIPLSPEQFDVFMSGVAVSSVAPKGRQHLSADALFTLVRSGCANIPDDRLGDPDIA